MVTVSERTEARPCFVPGQPIPGRNAGMGARVWLSLVFFAVALLQSAGYSLSSPGELTALTDGRAIKVVWWQDNKIMGYDTDRGETFSIKENVPMQDLYGPLFTADGTRILYWRTNAQNISGTYSIAWDGTDDRLLVDSCKPGGTWVDNATGKEWLFAYHRYVADGGKARYFRLVRCDMAQPSEQIVIAENASPWVTVHQSGSFVLTQRGGYNLNSDGYIKDWTYYNSYGQIKLGDIGCGTNLSPDPTDPDRLITLGAGHSVFWLSGAPTTIDFPRKDGESWYVRWSNDIKILSVVSPSTNSGGPLWIGKFAADFSDVEKWVQLIDGPVTSARTWVAPVCLEKPAITTHPADTTVEEGNVAFFRFGMSGCGKLTYQWFREGSAIPGANASRCRVEATMADSGSLYRCTVTNEFGDATTRAATLTVRRDITGPSVRTVSAPKATRVVVVFDEPVADSAVSLSHYSISPTINVAEAEIQPDGKTVWLTTALLSTDTDYQLTIRGVRDRASIPNVQRTDPDTRSFTFVSSDNVAPTAPSGLAVLSTTSAYIQLGWNESTDNVGIAAYRVLRDNGEIGLTSALSFMDTTILTDITYSYTVIALDSSGNTSPAGNAVTATAEQPMFSVTGPREGTVFQIGDTLPLSWRVDRASLGSVGIVFYISPDGGRTWEPIMNDQQYTPANDTGTYRWVIPPAINSVSLISDDVRLKVEDYNHSFEPGVLPWAIVIGPSSAVTRYPQGSRQTRVTMHGRHLSVGPFSTSGAVELFSISGRLIYHSNASHGETVAIPDSHTGRSPRILRVRSGDRTTRLMLSPHP